VRRREGQDIRGVDQRRPVGFDTPTGMSRLRGSISVTAGVAGAMVEGCPWPYRHMIRSAAFELGGISKDVTLKLPQQRPTAMR
jgi:hypothetical protein